MTTTDNLSTFFVSMYKNDKSSLSFLIEGAVPKIIMLSIYNLFVKYGEIIRIEDLSEDHKIELVSNCKVTGINFNNKTLIEAAKVLHTLKEINANNE